ncbi:MAG TPA: NIPSNAP family protein [Gammaproteobacteria bacterium]
MRRSAGRLAFIIALFLAPGAGANDNGSPSMESIQHLGEFPVIEFRRYTTVDGGRDAFAAYFESYFPESFQQLGAIALGQFLERDAPNGFTWLRGFKSTAARKDINTAFYYGPLWKEHRTRMNDLLIDSDNVLLLAPLNPGSGITLLPAVDVVADPDGAQGFTVAQIFAVEAGGIETFAKQAGKTFAAYGAAGAREAGVLVTLDAPNTFPQLPVRADGPYLVWLGLVKDDAALARLEQAVEQSLPLLSKTGLLRHAPELVVMQPTRRSRLRWLP